MRWLQVVTVVWVCRQFKVSRYKKKISWGWNACKLCGLHFGKVKKSCPYAASPGKLLNVRVPFWGLSGLAWFSLGVWLTCGIDDITSIMAVDVVFMDPPWVSSNPPKLMPKKRTVILSIVTLLEALFNQTDADLSGLIYCLKARCVWWHCPRRMLIGQCGSSLSCCRWLELRSAGSSCSNLF